MSDRNPVSGSLSSGDLVGESGSPIPRYAKNCVFLCGSNFVFTALTQASSVSSLSKNADFVLPYVYFSEAEIGQALVKGRSAVQQALHDLDDADLITRERYAGRMGRRIYLKVVLSEPKEDGKPAPPVPENRTSQDREIGPVGIGKPAPRNYTEKPESRNHTERAKGYGRYENVFLSDEQLQVLRAEYFSNLDRYIEELSVYLEASGKTYSNYEAGIRKWAANDHNKKTVSQPERDYSFIVCSPFFDGAGPGRESVSRSAYSGNAFPGPAGFVGN